MKFYLEHSINNKHKIHIVFIIEIHILKCIYLFSFNYTIYIINTFYYFQNIAIVIIVLELQIKNVLIFFIFCTTYN